MCENIINEKTKGAFVECGVCKGGSSMVMAYALEYFKEERELVLYDTFSGMTKPTDKDTKFSHGEERKYLEKWKECQKNDYTDWCYGSLEEVQKNLDKCGYDGVTFIKGDVLNTLPEMAPELIAVLRIDTDFYNSTKHIMNTLFPLVVDGGIVIFDDYFCWKGAHDAINEYFKENGISIKDIQRIDHSSAYYKKKGKRIDEY